MAITTDISAQLQSQADIETQRQQHQLTLNEKNAKLEALRMAKEIAMENHRAAPAGTVLSATDIVALASELEAFTSV